MAALCRLQQLSFCAEAWTKHPTLTAKLGSSLLSKQWSQEVDESGGKDRGSCGTNSVPRNKYAEAVIHQGSVSKDLPLSWQKDKIGGSVWPLERRRKRKRFLPSPHPAHTGEPQQEVLEMLICSITALKSQGPLPRSSLPTTNKALLHVPSV